MSHTRFNRVLTILLSVLMLLPLLVMSPVSTVSAAPSAIAVDMSSFEEASKLLSIYTTEYVTHGVSHEWGENVGVYSFDAKEGALKLHKSSVEYMGSYYRFHIKADNTPITNQTWMVVSYKTNATEKASLVLESNGNAKAKVVAAEDVSVSKGKYVRSTPVNLNGSGVSNLFERLRSGNHNALYVTLSKDTPDSVYFYINEICFFSTQALAESYAKDSSLPKDTNEFGSQLKNGKYVDGLHTYNKTTIGTCVYLPTDYTPDKEYPLIISFHDQGGGINKTVHNNGKKIYGDEFIMFAPICPTGSRWTVDKLKNGSYVYDSNNPSKVMSAVIDFVRNNLLVNYSIDKSRIYAVGQSLGGGGVWDFTTRAPDLVAAAFPVAGYCDFSQAINVADDVDIWLVHSMQDKSISVTAAHAMAASLMNLGKTNFHYTEYDLTDPAQKALFEDSEERSKNWEHWAWVPAFKDPDMLEFILTAEKPNTVRTVSRFTDVKSSDSYCKAVNYVADVGLFKGITETTFEPDTHMTRAMFVTVLGRLAGIDPAEYTGVSFTDVVAGSWYAPYVEWAASTGIVTGTGNGYYGTDDVITIEQACTILARYSDYATAPNDTLLRFEHYEDGEDVGSWAKEGVQWAMSNSIYMGQGMTLRARYSASRALVATMFYSYSKIFAN